MERIVLAVVMVAATTSRADARPALATRTEPPPTAALPLAPPSMAEPPASLRGASSRWYSRQVLISDVAVFSFAGLTRKPGVAYCWVGGDVIAHFGHGNVGRGLASATLRAGLPLVGPYLGAAGASHGEWCGLGEVLARGAIGMGSAELINVAPLAHDSVPTAATVRAAQHSHGVVVSPVVRVGRPELGLNLSADCDSWIAARAMNENGNHRIP